MHRSLIIAKMAPGSEAQVADIWTESDATELPRIAGVRHRSLYQLGELYVHLLETEEQGPEAVAAARKHPEFARISQRLDPFISPYLSTWRGPRDAMANCFYTWAPDDVG
jgi:cyclase